MAETDKTYIDRKKTDRDIEKREGGKNPPEPKDRRPEPPPPPPPPPKEKTTNG